MKSGTAGVELRAGGKHKPQPVLWRKDSACPRPPAARSVKAGKPAGIAGAKLGETAAMVPVPREIPYRAGFAAAMV